MTLAARIVCVVACASAIVAPAPAQAGAPTALVPPVDGPITRRFEPPASQFGPGHRGVDFGAAQGAPVRAAGGGTVTFAGAVAGVNAVTIDHGGGLETTYSRLADVYVAPGEAVQDGHWLGTAGSSHAGTGGGLHLGVKLQGAYVDPEGYLGALYVGRAIHLAPLDETASPSCRPPGKPGLRPPPPSDNVAVAIPGIASETTGAEGPRVYGRWLKSLGYRPGDSYVFSYRGLRGPRLHERYERADTYGRLVGAARGLRALLARIGRMHPGTDVDLVAHSQGGLVARAVLTQLVRNSDPDLPRVEHVVTLASPHRGAPLAGGVSTRAPGGRGILIGLLSRLAERGWLPIPQSDAEALGDLAPGSGLLVALARQDLSYGTRLLSLAMPHDLLVPADRSAIAHELSRVVGPRGVWAHREILRSKEARALAYDFLRDAPDPCRTAWDVAGPVMGEAVGWATALLGRLLP